MSFGSAQLSAAARFMAGFYSTQASAASASANVTGIQAGWDRRKAEWQFQSQTASLEIKQINDQIQAANTRVAIAQADLDNQNLQISNASDVLSFLQTKYTNQALYDWMVSQVSAVYFQCYQMAYTLAKQAEACFIFERVPDLSTYTNYIQFGYWDSLKKGLLAGERLYLDLKRLEIAYQDQNQREYEITKSISLLLLDPIALMNLKETGQCTVQFPEALFDMDYPGHYMRRIKSLSLTIPCVTGPYTGVNCTLTMVANRIRFNSDATDATSYTAADSSQNVTNFASMESIATSTAQNDSGLFEVNFSDERYLPFEGAGVVSSWQLSMPPDTNAFDLDTITDVIFNLKYTARDGGTMLASVARAAAFLPPGSRPSATVGSPANIPSQSNLVRMFSLRHEFPSDCNKFLNTPDAVADQSMTLTLAQERFPFQYRGKTIQINQIDVFLKFRDIHDSTTYKLGQTPFESGTPLGDYAAGKPLKLSVAPPKGVGKEVTLTANANLLNGVPWGSVPQPAPQAGAPSLGSVGPWTILAKGKDINDITSSLRTSAGHLNSDAIEDLYLACHYTAAAR
jgi:hypothetical protein